MIDVLVIGGGNAALCAALMAREAGASVLLLEAAPREWRGGNSQHTRNLRCMHDAPQDVLVDAYPEEEFWQDLLKVTGGLTDEKLARLVIRASSTCRDWMRAHGVHFQPPLSGALHVARTNAFFMGGGKALVNAYYRSAEALGRGRSATTRRSTRWSSTTAASSPRAIGARAHRGAGLRAGGRRLRIQPRVAARGLGRRCDGEWVADNFLIRGTRFNMGVLLKSMLDAGADAIGDPSQSHCVAIDARAPLYDGGICTRIDCVSLGIVVNRDARALLRRGRGLLAQALRDLGPAGRAAAGADRLLDHRRQGDRPLHAAGVPGHEGGHAAGARARARPARGGVRAHRERVQRRVPAGHVRPHGARRLPHRRTRRPPRRTGRARSTRRRTTATRCARASRSPISASRTNERAAVHFGGQPSPNLFVAGEMMAGNVLGKGYTAGVGMSIGTAFGRIAGAQAAAAALAQRGSHHAAA